MEIIYYVFIRPRFRSEVDMNSLTEKELDFLYWVLVDYCENNISDDIKTQAKVNRVFKKIANEGKQNEHLQHGA